jgi:hypothetical protein
VTPLDLRDIAMRALKTALQAALAVITVEAFTEGLSDLSVLATYGKAAGLAAVAAAFSVVHNAVLSWSSS